MQGGKLSSYQDFLYAVSHDASFRFATLLFSSRRCH
jgi:hypothetical protein